MINAQELRELQQQHGEALLSIITPTSRFFPQNDKNPIIIKNMLKETEKRLSESYDPQRVNALMQKLNTIEKELDFSQMTNGLALFVSDDVSKVVHLPFCPAERINVGNSFYTRDLMKAHNHHAEYLFLLLSIDNICLYRGKGSLLYEIKNKDFPMCYGGPKRRDPLTEITRQGIDTAELGSLRKFLCQVDDHLFDIVHNYKTPLFVAGEAEYISFIKDRNQSGKFITGYLQENFSYFNEEELAKKLTPIVKEYLQQELEQQLLLLQEAIGYNKAALGIYDVWRAAKLGQILTLLVEDSYTQPAHVPQDNVLDLHLLESMPVRYEAGYYDDIVDEIIEDVTQMDGAAQFVGDNRLDAYGRIAAILRYERIESDNENVKH